jgi:enamine deaminase RidA (YjgF/YER057c/UK114 family)
MGLWAKSVVIFNSIRDHGKQSIRRLADRTGLSKSSVHRHLQARDRRDRYPESWFWETEVGRTWLIRLVVATLFVFGLKRGVGAETMSAFFSRLHVEAHVGCSPSALRHIMHTLEHLILETGAAWEQEGIAHGEIRPVIGAVDETFLQHMMLVFMDLATGYLLMEEVAEDRRFDTWYDRVNGRLKTFGTEVLYLVSDRAKALIKLARTGLGCLSIPDLFHLSHDLTKGYSLSIFSRLRQAKRDLEQAKQRLETVQQHAQANPAHIEQVQAQVVAWAASVNHWQEVSRTWRQHLAKLSRLLHPWRLADSTRQTSKAVEKQLRAELEAIATLLEINGLPVKPDTLDKVCKQLPGISALVDFWWQTVRQDLAQMAMTPRWTQWAEELLLPLMYWHEQLRRTRGAEQKAQIALVLQAVEEAFERHACTGQLNPEVLAGWKAWAADHAKAFQRASSAVEGRNGYLSQMQHNHRGLPRRRYPVWTVLHNFDCRAADGTTPASRFFRRSFPDLFESVLSQIDALPMPRQRCQTIAASH